MSRMRIAGCILGLVAFSLSLGAPALSYAAGPPDPAQAKTPIQHLVVLMQEQHSFDNYFGTYPGANGLPSGVCMPLNPLDSSNKDCVKPFHLADTALRAPANIRDTFQLQYRAGHMDGFINAFRQVGKTGTSVMGYYDQTDIQYYWNLANDYLLFDRFFSAAAAGSVTNHMYWVAGAPGAANDQLPDTGWGDLPTIFDRLQAAGVSWKFYVQNYDASLTYRHREHGPRDTQIVRVPLLAFDRFIDDPALAGHIVDLNTYYDDVRNGTLPAVAYIAPLGASEQPPGDVGAGQRFVKGLVDTLVKSDAWDSSAFILTYDYWGGWYDHVAPPQVDAYGYGFRVPTLLVSPYVRKGAIDSTTYDVTSILKFIEDNYGLKPLATRDAQATSIAKAFNFSQAPRAPQIISLDPPAGTLAGPRRVVLELSYGGALVIAALVIAWAAFGARFRVRSVYIRSLSAKLPSRKDGKR